MCVSTTPSLPPNEARGAADGLGAKARPGAVGAAGVERDADHRHVKVGNLNEHITNNFARIDVVERGRGRDRRNAKLNLARWVWFR